MAPQVHNENPDPIDDADWIKIWNSPLTAEEIAAYGLAYFCGLRTFEICGLRTDQFLSTPKYRMTDVERKGGHKHTLPWLSWVALIADKRPDLLPEPQRLTRAVDKLTQGTLGCME